jgi:hypothetical protein
LQRKKYVDEAKTLSREISKLNELVSSKKLILQVWHSLIYKDFRLILYFQNSVSCLIVFIHSSLSFELHELVLKNLRVEMNLHGSIVSL